MRREAGEIGPLAAEATACAREASELVYEEVTADDRETASLTR
jgi:hypothetical protein